MDPSQIINADSAMFSADWKTMYLGAYKGTKSGNHFIEDVVVEIYPDGSTYVFGWHREYKFGKANAAYRTQKFKWSWRKFELVPTGEWKEEVARHMCWHTKSCREFMMCSNNLDIIILRRQ